MRQLKQVGYFRELRHGDTAGPSLTAARGQLHSKNRDAILSYLRSAPIHWATGYRFDDVLDSSHKSIDLLGIATDGEWEWPTDLPYYVETYGVGLPDEFVEHMRTNNWEPPQLTEDELGRLSEPCGDPVNPKSVQ